MRSASQPPPANSRADASATPLLAAMDLLGQRWILRVIWELEPGPLGFLELRRRMGNCSSSMLSVRLQRLSEAAVLEKKPDKSYELTTAGRQLAEALQPVWKWSERWADNLEHAGDTDEVS
ncbi:helix-turn-helix domain-containing protein [Nocardia sp. CDC153]|uniref:winged helix-turn-helix transcriptional regulator n=1 Tax=Nocardia sp. CDC153 TaxID=3112167 RepID=UPI002DBC6485|nr:helix-turn-helix domain-containing protein [Nocardia sp. CDC153]MEC3957807.1 helix-turn-helix domain-containing protein [Nocardia sp. CDC153]